MINPLISVIVPIYNVGDYLECCIKSIIKQTFTEIEIILVDDGSTDDCLDICRKYEREDERIVVISKANGGLVSARKAGVKIAKGNYVLSVDGDDWIDEDYISSFATIIHDCNADIICSGLLWEYEKKTKKTPLAFKSGFYQRCEMEKEIIPYIITAEDGTYFPPNLATKAIKRELYKNCQLQIDERITLGEDFVCFVPCVCNANSIFIASFCKYHYRQHSGAMTKEKKPEDANRPKELKKQLEKTIDLNAFDFTQQMNRKMVHSLFNICASYYLAIDNRDERKKKLRELLNRSEYDKAIEECKYKKVGALRYKMMRNALKYRLFFLIKLYNII